VPQVGYVGTFAGPGKSKQILKSVRRGVHIKLR
jgi:hypothetical protein